MDEEKFNHEKARLFEILDLSLKNQAEATTLSLHNQYEIQIENALKKLKELYLEYYTF